MELWYPCLVGFNKLFMLALLLFRVMQFIIMLFPFRPVEGQMYLSGCFSPVSQSFYNNAVAVTFDSYEDTTVTFKSWLVPMFFSLLIWCLLTSDCKGTSRSLHLFKTVNPSGTSIYCPHSSEYIWRMDLLRKTSTWCPYTDKNVSFSTPCPEPAGTVVGRENAENDNKTWTWTPPESLWSAMTTLRCVRVQAQIGNSG